MAVTPELARREMMRHLEERAKTRAKQRFHEMRFLKQAAVTAEALTGNDTWDAFLRVLAGSIEASKKHLAQLAESICDTSLDETTANTLRLEMICTRERIKTLEHVVALPKAIMTQGDEAAKFMEGEDADS